MEDKKIIKNTDEYKKLKVGELEVSGGNNYPSMNDDGTCPHCRSRDYQRTGKKRDVGPFGWFNSYEYHCNICGHKFWN